MSKEKKKKSTYQLPEEAKFLAESVVIDSTIAEISTDEAVTSVEVAHRDEKIQLLIRSLLLGVPLATFLSNPSQGVVLLSAIGFTSGVALSFYQTMMESETNKTDLTKLQETITGKPVANLEDVFAISGAAEITDQEAISKTMLLLVPVAVAFLGINKYLINENPLSSEAVVILSATVLFWLVTYGVHTLLIKGRKNKAFTHFEEITNNISKANKVSDPDTKSKNNLFTSESTDQFSIKED